ncbi:ATP-binding protein [Pseudooceanicola sp. LIPI14-2-Ac024]|uniref:hybrid sensor histidine kinase/response regulator n=1 Tax=Pseudooceanicola sp. LIPI14-2-Ac024 TaxID=3344875 RepID=UPI0035CE9BD0
MAGREPPALAADEEALRQRTRARAGLALAALAVCVALVVGMALFVLREIEELSRANSDNLQWSLAQTDVEFLRFQLALEHAQVDPATLAQVRQRFDIFYSRVSTLERGEVYREMRDNPAFDEARARIGGFLDRTVTLIDGPDQDLRAALPVLSDEAAALFPQVRGLSLAGLTTFAELSDQRREHLLNGLVLLAVVLAAVFAGLILLAYFLYRLYRLAEYRAEEVQRAGERMRTIVETSPEAIVVTDGTGTIREFNPQAQSIFGYSRDEARHRNAIDLIFPPEDAARLRAGLLSFVETGTTPDAASGHFEATAMARDGRRFPGEFAIARAESGPLLITYVRDISRRKAAEEGLTEARDRALAGERAKAEFLAVMSHEMRTPLNGMLGSMQLFRDHTLTEKQTELLDRMDSSGRLLLGLVNDVLELSKFEAGKMTAERRPFSVPRLLDGVIETAAPMAAAAQTALGWQWVGAPCDTAVGDSRRLRQVLLNLVGNAVKFTRNGEVDVEVEALGDGTHLEFRVIDTGIGISAGDLDRIFRDFETLDSSYARQAGGTGLGLGIAQRLTRLMGGDIGVESEPGEGSLFWVRVPVLGVEATVPSPSQGTPTDAGPVRPLDLLLVEDNEVNRYVARQMLEAEGHRVTEAVNGQAGVEWAESHRFDAILMDVSMPVMDGPEATRRIRSGQGPSADRPIIAVTAHALPEEVEGFRTAGMDRCISKPVDRAELIATLAEIAGGGIEGASIADPAAHARSGLVDYGHLAVLWQGLPSERRGEVFDRFLVEVDQAIADLSTSAPDSDGLVARVHACAGNCGTFGATALREELARLETAAKRGQEISRGELTALAPLWADSRAALLEWRAAA